MKVIDSYVPDSEFYTQERCHITEIHNSEQDADCSIARARVEPGVTTALHYLKNAIERYVILEGQGEVAVDGRSAVPVQSMDVVNIPRGVSQQITNTGTTDLVFLCICTPRFTPDDYVSIEP